MIPDPGRILALMAQNLTTGVIPALRADYAIANAGLIAQLLLVLAQDADRAMATRMADVEQIRSLLADATTAPMAVAWTDDVVAGPASMRLSDLDALHGRLMGHLIELHAWAEDHDDALNQRIWGFLADHVARHSFDLAA